MKWYTKKMRHHDMDNGLIVLKVWATHIDPAGPAEQRYLTIHTIPREFLPMLESALETIKDLVPEIPF